MSFLKGLNAHMVVIGALILRETRTRFGKHYLGYLWAFLEPVLWISSFFLIFHFAGRNMPYRMDIVSFITTGLLPFIMFRQSVSRMMGAINANKALLFFPQVQIIDLIISRALIEMGTMFSVFWIIMIFNSVYRESYEISSFLEVFASLCLANLIGSGIGLVAATANLYNNVVERLIGLLMRPLIFISGIFYTADSLPDTILKYAQYNPLFQLIEMMRQGWFPYYTSSILDLSYIFKWVTISWLMALTLERIGRKKLEFS